MFDRITAAPRGADGDHGAAAVHVTRALLRTLQTLTEQIEALKVQITEQLALHADAHAFTSLPRTGALRAARLLAEIGDARGRFPTPEALASLAGVAPSTRQSGRSTVVGFRWAADRQLRDALVEWAGVRILARAWVYVIWRCWQDHAAYDPDHHAGLQQLTTAVGPDMSPAGVAAGTG